MFSYKSISQKPAVTEKRTFDFKKSVKQQNWFFVLWMDSKVNRKIRWGENWRKMKTSPASKIRGQTRLFNTPPWAFSFVRCFVSPMSNYQKTFPSVQLVVKTAWEAFCVNLRWNYRGDAHGHECMDTYCMFRYLLVHWCCQGESMCVCVCV